MSSDVNGSGNSSTVFDDPNPPINPDVTGLAVCVINVVMNSCLRILITFSPEDIDEGIRALLLQAYSILLSTFISANRNQLSIDDAYTVLSLTSSPLIIHLTASSLGSLCGMKTNLYDRIKYHRPIIRVLGALIPVLWLALSATIAFSGRAFTDSGAYSSTPFGAWLADSLLYGNFFWGWFFPAVPSTSAAFLVVLGLLMRSHIAVACATYLRKKPRSRKWLFAPWAFVKSFWLVIHRRHQRALSRLYLMVDILWGYITIVTSPYYDSQAGYFFGYGQALAAFSSLPIIISTIKLIASHQRVNHFLRNTLWSFFAGICFFRKCKEVLYVWGSCLPFTRQMSLLPRFYSTAEQVRMNRNGGSRPYTGSETSQEVPPGPVPEQPPNPEDSAAGIPHSASPERVQSPRSFDTDIPLAAAQDISLALSSYTTTVETIESICKAHKLSPLAAELVVERLREKLSLVHRRLRDRDVDSNERSPSAAPPNAVSTSINVPRRAGTYG